MRSLWKGIFQIINTKRMKRNITISPKLLGLNILIHNGKIFRRKYITKLMIKRKSKKLGDFVATRKITSKKL